MFAKLDVGNNAQVKTGATAGIDHTKAIAAQKTIVVNDLIRRRIITQRNAKIKVLLIKSEVIKIARLSLDLAT